MAYKIGDIVDLQEAEVPVMRNGRVLFYVTLAGPEHPKRKAIEWARLRRLKASLQRTNRIELLDPEQQEIEDFEELVSSIFAWRGVLDEKGNDVPCTAENVRKFLSHEGHGWIREQLKEALKDRDRFIRDSAQAS